MDKSILQPLTKKTRNLKKGIWNLLYYWHAGPFLAPEGPEAQGMCGALNTMVLIKSVGPCP